MRTLRANHPTHHGRRVDRHLPGRLRLHAMRRALANNALVFLPSLEAVMFFPQFLCQNYRRVFQSK
jgi:hypothetical protein